MTAVMDTYDPLAYLPSPMAYHGGPTAQNLDYMSATSGLGDGLDRYSTFESEAAYVSGDDMSYLPSGPGATGNLQHSAMVKRHYSNTFEDPFAQSTISQYNDLEPEGSPDNSSVDRDSRYLSFSLPQFPYVLLNESFQRCSININAQLHGMFFLAESQWPASADTAPPPPELTCYRRNLFQITGSITLPRTMRYIFTDEGSRIPIYELELQVSATESVEGNPVKIISVPWKTPAAGENIKPEDKVEREPPTIPLDKMAGSDIDTDYTTFPFQWKRLQFRIATANNGRRKELQQHFNLHLKVLASLSTGGKFPIAEAHSGAVIVRGRSPRNFASRKDVPLSSSSTSRKHVPSLSRASVSQSSVPQVTSAPRMQSPHEDASQATPPLDHPDTPASGPDIAGWQQQQAAAFQDQLASPTYGPGINPPTSMGGFVGQPSPLEGGPFNFAFGPGATGAGNDAVSVHFDSDTEGSPYQQPSSIAHARPPTSNPTSHVGGTGKPRSSTMSNIPTSQPSDPYKRPRLQSHVSSTGTLPTLSTMPTAVTTPLHGPPHRGSLSEQKPQPYGQHYALPHSPAGDSVDKLYEYFPLSVEDWQPPVDAVFRPHVVHHEAPRSMDMRSPVSGRTSKRYFSEIA